MPLRAIFLCLIALCLSTTRGWAADNIVFADFEGKDYGAWTVEGTAFGAGPAPGALPGQMPVAGFAGRGLASSFHGGDGAQGRLTSPPFPISRRYITFLIGGGGFPGQTSLNLIVEGKIVRTATGPNTDPGGRERLALGGWDVGELAGKTAHLEIVDAATGGWGHISVDQIIFTDTKPTLPAPVQANVSRDILASHRWLTFPIQNGAARRTVTLRVGGREVCHFEADLADAAPEWWAPLDVSAWHGQTLTVSVDHLPGDSHALDQLTQTDGDPWGADLYHEKLRPQFHFSARRGWLNDPNGLVYFGGQYHLFFQHSPFTWGDSAKWWGQAVSRDLVHWEEVGEALAPDALGAMWSGSGAVDTHNTSGLGHGNKPPLVLTYTAAGDPFTQCLAASTDGRAFTKFAGNPVVKNITPGNRDPRIFWYEPAKHWVMALWVGQDGHNTIHLLTSPNLRDWTPGSVVDGGTDADHFLYECPDMFALPLDGDHRKMKWILTAANGEYAVGAFDGRTFAPEATRLPGLPGAVYAPQTFSDEPKGRRIQIGWFRTDTPGMPFNQSMSLPVELNLVTTPAGPRLTRTPIPELHSLRARSHDLGALTLRPGEENPLAGLHSELAEIHAEFEPAGANDVTFTVRGVPVVYETATQELVVNGFRTPAPLRGGVQRITVFVDRTGLEVFASDGLTYVPAAVNVEPADLSLAVAVSGGAVKFRRLEIYELRSAWNGWAVRLVR